MQTYKTIINNNNLIKISKRTMMSKGNGNKIILIKPKNACNNDISMDAKTNISSQAIPPIEQLFKEKENGYDIAKLSQEIEKTNKASTFEHNSSTNEYEYEIAKKPLLLDSPVIKTTPIKYKIDSIEKSDGEPLSAHEYQHINLLEERQDGSKTISSIATSSKINTITKQKNVDAGTPNMSGDCEKPQRFATLNQPRMLDPSIKEGEHFTVEDINDVYYQQLPANIKQQIAFTNRQAETNKIPILRVPKNSPQTLNDMGYSTQTEYDKNDFHE